MNGLGSYLLEVAARCLEGEDREVVLGDLAEGGENAWRGFLDIFGLVVRRQVSLWCDWRPWVAAFALALPGSFFLMGCSVTVGLVCVHWGEARFLGFGGREMSPGLGLLLRQISLLAGLSWAGGFAVGSLSRPTLWASVITCALPCLFCLMRFRVESLPPWSLFLFLPTAVLGAWLGWRRVTLARVPALALAMALTAALLPVWGGQPANLQTWVFNGILCWPVWYLVAATKKASNAETQPK